MSFFDFSDVTDEEINEYRQSDFLLKEERCTYKVIKSVPYVGKTSGKKSIELTLDAKDSTGKKAKVFCYLVPGPSLIRFLDTHGMEDAIRSRSVNPSDLLGKEGSFQNKHDEYNGEKKNAVHYFVKPKAANVLRETSKTPDLVDDDIPF